jgi:hypothetical protein
MAYFFNRIIKSLTGFMNVIFLRTDTVAAGQAVDGIQNAEQTVGFDGIQCINGTARMKSAFYIPSCEEINVL